MTTTTTRSTTKQTRAMTIYATIVASSCLTIAVVLMLSNNYRFAVGFQIGSPPAHRRRGKNDPSSMTTMMTRAMMTRSTTTTTTALSSSTVDSSGTTTTTTDAVEWKMTPRDILMDVATKWKDEFGLFLVDKKAKKELAAAVEGVEATYVPPADLNAKLTGAWDLVSTTSTTTPGIDTGALLPGPLKRLSEKISGTANRYVSVQQAIRCDDVGTIYRVDHVLSYRPPNALTELFDNLPTPLASFNVNPLDVSRSKIVLVHKAVQSGIDPSKISLTLSSIILNVAGNSTYLDPAGKDVTSINLPLSDFLGGGEFITTYVDDELRISRGKQAGLSVLRVFVKRPHEEPESVGVDPGAVSEIPDAEIIAAVDGSSSDGQSQPSDVE